MDIVIVGFRYYLKSITIYDISALSFIPTHQTKIKLILHGNEHNVSYVVIYFNITICFPTSQSDYGTQDKLIVSLP